MTLEHKYYSFDEMPEGYEFMTLGHFSKFRKVNDQLEVFSDTDRKWTGATCGDHNIADFIPLPPEPKLYEKYLNSKRELAIKGLNGLVTLKITLLQPVHENKQTIKEAIPAINAFLEDICGDSNIPTAMSMPDIGSVWVNKRTRREVTVIDVVLEGNYVLNMIVYEYPPEPNHPRVQFRELLSHWYKTFEPMAQKA